MTDQELLDGLKKLSEQLGKSPTAVDCNYSSLTANVSTYMNRFGSWNKAKELAGCLATNKFGAKTDDELILSLQNYYELNGKAPIQSQCRVANGLYGPNTYKDRFGGWEQALAAAGISKNALKSTQVSDEWLLDSLREFYRLNATAPTHDDCNSINEHLYLKSHMVYTRRFGTFTDALILAGVPLNIRESSAVEKELYLAIQSIYSGEIRRNDKILSGRFSEVDIYLPELNLAIEFNGLYWHNDEFRDKHYHIGKTRAAAALGIRLIHVLENEWKYKKEIVLSRLIYIMGLDSSRVYARNCTIKEISSEDANLFLDSTHIQGSVNCSVRLGLYHNDILAAVQTYSKSRFSTKYEWELVRYSGSVIGGASKLFKYFINTRNPVSIISYSDLRWNTGKLYETLGFTLSHTSDPNYWYFKALKLESRIKYQKHKLSGLLDIYDESKSEVDNMRANGFKRIFDCGNLVYVYVT